MMMGTIHDHNSDENGNKDKTHSLIVNGCTTAIPNRPRLLDLPSGLTAAQATCTRVLGGLPADQRKTEFEVVLVVGMIELKSQTYG